MVFELNAKANQDKARESLASILTIDTVAKGYRDAVNRQGFRSAYDRWTVEDQRDYEMGRSAGTLARRLGDPFSLSEGHHEIYQGLLLEEAMIGLDDDGELAGEAAVN